MSDPSVTEDSVSVHVISSDDPSGEEIVGNLSTAQINSDSLSQVDDTAPDSDIHDNGSADALPNDTEETDDLYALVSMISSKQKSQCPTHVAAGTVVDPNMVGFGILRFLY